MQYLINSDSRSISVYKDEINLTEIKQPTEKLFWLQDDNNYGIESGEIQQSLSSITNEDKLNSIRHYRNILLKECDWSILSDSPLSEADKTKYLTYRQALRDLPQTENLDLDNPIYPSL